MNARTVLMTLLRMYRPILLWFGATLVVGVAIGDLVLDIFAEPAFSLWMFVAGSAVKYWLGVIGVMLVSLHLRQFVAAGVTRRALIAAGLALGVLVSLGVGVLITLGHGLEDRSFSTVGAGYPAWSPSVAVSEFGHVFPTCLAFFVSGAAAAAGFYRFGAWGGLAVVVPAILPGLLSEELLGISGTGGVLTRNLPYAAALAVSFGVSVLGGLLYQWLIRDVAIRRATTR
ncbi:hypothetical protein AB0368_11845 [Actinoplanes sp. NPDC051475]|uniref:hypothetical protein n=1 Tax=Actinoplanes sp. NPDC051475 TaxID=3157225 RepID=UPI00344C7ED5